MRILHLTFHQGLTNEMNSLSKELGVEIVTKRFQDGVSQGSAIYSVGKAKATAAWEKYKDYYMQFDVIITSDTVPISRVFLQNGWPEIPGKRLIIWVCNRFDYFDQASRDCLFPDREYYELIRQANFRKNVHIMGYTKFENHYGKYIKNTNFGNDVTTPIGILSNGVWNYKSNPEQMIGNTMKKDTFFVPPYHNDTIFMKLSDKLNELGIPNFNGRYNGPLELADFKGIIHIPYAWSNLALFEAWQLGVIYFIPSLQFIKRMTKMGNFFWSPPLVEPLLHLSEWYDPQHSSLFVYFNSWEDLQNKIKTTDYPAMKDKIQEYGRQHKERTLKKWREILDL